MKTCCIWPSTFCLTVNFSRPSSQYILTWWQTVFRKSWDRNFRSEEDKVPADKICIVILVCLFVDQQQPSEKSICYKANTDFSSPTFLLELKTVRRPPVNHFLVHFRDHWVEVPLQLRDAKLLLKDVTGVCSTSHACHARQVTTVPWATLSIFLFWIQTTPTNNVKRW